MKVYAVLDQGKGEFITNGNGRFLYVRVSDAKRIKTSTDYVRTRFGRDKDGYVSDLAVAEAEVGEWSVIEDIV